MSLFTDVRDEVKAEFLARVEELAFRILQGLATDDESDDVEIDEALQQLLEDMKVFAIGAILRRLMS